MIHESERTLRIQPTRRVAGAIRVPGDKSISHRYVILAAIARGQTRITNLAPGADVASTAACFGDLGVAIRAAEQTATVDGAGWPGLRAAAGALDAGNSGTTLRLLAGLLAGRPFRSTLTGDASIRRRPMARVIAPLEAMGAVISSNAGRAPMTIDGAALHGVTWRLEIASAQVKSAIMLAALSATGQTTVVEPVPTRDHSERAFPLFGLDIVTRDGRIDVPGGQEGSAPAQVLEVPGDPSSAAVWSAAAAALPGSDVTLPGVLLNPRRLGFAAALRSMGADISIDETGRSGGEPIGTLRIRHQSHGSLHIGAADVPDLIDELPVLAARAALGGSLDVRGAGELRVKESDRIRTLVTGLRALGVDADERDDGFVIDGRHQPAGGVADAAGDHRLVMAFALVGLGATGATTVTGADAVAISYPAFARDLAALAS